MFKNFKENIYTENHYAEYHYTIAKFHYLKINLLAVQTKIVFSNTNLYIFKFLTIQTLWKLSIIQKNHSKIIHQKKKKIIINCTHTEAVLLYTTYLNFKMYMNIAT